MPRTQHFILTAVLGLLALAATWTQLGQALEHWGYRAAAWFAPAATPETTVHLVVLDPGSPLAMRAQAAAVIPRLEVMNPRVIGLMLALDEAASPPELAAARWEARVLQDGPRGAAVRLRKALSALDADRRLGKAIADTDRLVVGARWKTTSGRPAEPWDPTPMDVDAGKRSIADRVSRPLLQPPGRGERVLPPLAQFREVAHHIAVVPGWPAGTRVEGLPLAVREGEHLLPGLALTLAARMMQTRAVVIPPRGVQLGKRRIGTGPGNWFYPQPLEPEAARKRVAVHSARNVIERNGLEPAIRGRAVIIAPGLAEGAPGWKGPAGARWSPGEWTAQTLAALLDGEGVHQPFWFYGAQRGAVLLLALYLIFLPRRLRGRLGLGISTIAAVALLNAGLIALLTRSLWLPVVAPALFVLGAHVLVALHHRAESVLARARRETVEARRELGENLHNQGRLGAAFEQFQKCGADPAVREPLYQLGLEYERRRQFPKAVNVYETLATIDAGYRDIGERRVHLDTVVANLPGPGPSSTTSTGTIALDMDNPGVEKPTLGRYQVHRLLGRGAMGAVYLGEDPNIGRELAIKVLPLAEEFEGQALEDARGQLHREAEAAGRLRHPNIVAVYDVGEEHDLAYIVMDYAEGRALEAWTEPGDLLPVNEVLEVCAAVADALAYAHDRKVIHRDIKPGNIIYDREGGSVKVTDFGVASLIDKGKTRTGMVLGSPSYMSPEQIAGGKLDGRSDLFSLGVAMYQLLSGRLPFSGDSLANLTYRITTEKHANLGKVRRGIPTCASRIVNKALQKDPAKRYTSGAEMAEALRRCRGKKTTTGGK